jgi:arylsulfatase A
MFASKPSAYSLVAAGSLLAGIGFIHCSQAPQKKDELPRKPNILIFYADDIGFGDIGCYGAIGVETPHIDYLAANGVRFTDAHCAAATCSPSRYSLLTGNYPFRIRVGILPGDAPLLIRPGIPTLASELGSVGYQSAAIGKWHLGMGDGKVDWNTEIKPGPLEIGFDYSFIIPATNDRVPCVYVENHHVYGSDPDNPMEITFTDNARDPNPYGNPTGLSHPEVVRQRGDIQHSGVIVNGVPRIGFMGGGEKSWWRDEDFPEIFTQKAIDFIDSTGDDPFFLFFAFNEIHVPRIPNEMFVGKSTMGPRGDAIVQMDYMVGKIMTALVERGLIENTLVIFSSDNGPVLDDGYADQAWELLGDHKPAGPFRGGKYSIFEGGNRIPTITYWPGVISGGQVNEALWTQTDFFISFARLAGYEVPNGQAIDSEDMLDVILGRSGHGREYLLEEAGTFALRKGQWKYILPKQGAPATISFDDRKKIEMGVISIPQLYNLDDDPGEQNNLAEQFPERVNIMHQKLIEMLGMTD